MILIIGGAYQGKLAFAKRKFHIKDEQVLNCPPDFSLEDHFVSDDISPLTLLSSFPYSCISNSVSQAQERSRFSCINHLENFTLSCIRNDMDSTEIFRENKNLWVDSILLCTDIFCGVVPVDAEMRRWREETGRLCAYLSQEADQVYRIFCGLEQQLK